MNLKEQRYVCTLADTGKLSLAAKQLFISQPALSLYISKLEDSLEVKLFERVGKRFLLTKMGEIYVEKARQMLELKASFDMDLAGYHKGRKERLRVAMQDIRSQHISPKLIQAFDVTYPKVDLIWYEGNYNQLEEMLLRDQIELFFCNCPIRKKGLVYTPIFHDKLKLVVPENHPMVTKAKTTPDGSRWIDLKLFTNDRFILQNEGQSLYDYSAALFRECNMAPKNIFTIRKIQTMLRLINDGFGVGFCQESYLHYTDGVNKVKLFDVGTSQIKIEFSAVYNKDRELSPYARALIDILKEII